MDKTMWAMRNNDPYNNHWEKETRGAKEDAAWSHQTWEQQNWEAQDWHGQEECEEEDVEQEEEEE
eukprot:12850906-Heterocapsa_arctica.AAC.1